MRPVNEETALSGHRPFPPPPKLGRLVTCYSLPLWVGIDPGFFGAIAVIDESSKFISCHDMPITGDEGRQSEIDCEKLAKIVEKVVTSYPVKSTVLLEWPQTRPDEAPESSKRFGVGLGLLEGMFAYTGNRPKRVAPNQWKGRLGLAGKLDDPQAAKLAAVEMAERVIGQLPTELLRGPRGGLKDGRAEALLIAWEGLTRTRAGLAALPEDLRIWRVCDGGNRGSRGRRKREGPVI